MSALHEEYHVGMLLGYSPVPCIMCNIRKYGPEMKDDGVAVKLTVFSALDCLYCGGSMVRMVPPGYTSEQAVRLRRLRYTDLPASMSLSRDSIGSSSGRREPGQRRGSGGQPRPGSGSRT